VTDFDEITTADGTRIAFRRLGGGRPVVMLHGSGGGLHSWSAVADRLANEHEVWLVARRGYGPSEVPERPKRFSDEVADVQGVIAAASETTGSVDLVGASYGAMVALHAALAGAGGLRSLSLWEPPLFTAGPPTAIVLDEYRGRLAAGDVDGANLLLMERVARVPRALLAQLARGGAAEDPEEARRSATGWLHDLEALADDSEDMERWSRVALPVLLMQGARTWEPMPATMEAIARQLPHVQRVEYADQMHFAPSVAPDLVAATLRTFLRNVP